MSDGYDDEMERVFREVTQGSDLKSEQEGSRFKRDPGPHLECDPSDEPPLRPLCRECVRELPAVGSDLCEFCQVITP